MPVSVRDHEKYTRQGTRITRMHPLFYSRPNCDGARCVLMRARRSPQRRATNGSLCDERVSLPPSRDDVTPCGQATEWRSSTRKLGPI